MLSKAASRLPAPSILRQNSCIRLFATQVKAADPDTTLAKLQDDYSKASPFSKVPGPSKLTFLRTLLPGGKYFKMDFDQIIKYQREEYGDLFKLPALFGGVEFIASHNPNDFQTIFRTEGQWPERTTFQTLAYFRKKVRPDIYGKYAGLGNAQGKEWGDFRSAVNPAMAQPRNTKIYIPKVDSVAVDFVRRILEIRDPKTNQVPETFEDDINKWTLESVALIAMDTRLGLLAQTYNDRSAKLIQASKDATRLVFDLEFKPSLWRIFETPDFKRLMTAFNAITDLSDEIIEEAKVRIEKKSKDSDENEQGVLEKLLKIDPLLAKVMAIDMLFGGIDTTSSAFTGLLYLLARNPEKQEILRQEILTILPQKDSPLTVENMTNLPYLRACLKESLRIHPPANANVRLAGQNLVLSGYQIPKGTPIAMGSSLLYMDEKYFPNAEKYEPERWLRKGSTPASTKAANPFIFLPFGFGPRMCIAKRFAEMEIETAIARILRNFHVEWHHSDLKFRFTSVKVPDGKLMFTFKDIVN